MNKAIAPRSRFDRQMARIEQQVVWENSPGAVRRDLERIQFLFGLLEEVAEIKKAFTKPYEQLRAIAAQREIVALAHQIDKETLIDRTYPLLERISHEDAMRVLPVPEADIVPQGEDDESRRLAEASDLLREALRLIAAPRADGQRTPLVMIRGGAAQ